MLQCSDVICGGETGQFCANSDSVGWKGSSVTVYPTSSIRRAERCEGRLRILCEVNGGTEVFALDGFKNTDFDPLWKYFEQTCQVYLKKHRPKAALEEGDFDAAMQSIEDGADRVDDAAKGSVQKKAKEADLMRVEIVRDGLDEAVSGDKQALSRVFAANGCERIGRLRLVVDTVHLEVYHTDPRWKHLLSKCATIEAVLKELGTFRPWKPSAEGHSDSLLRRAMVREMRHRQGDDEVTEVQESETIAPADVQEEPKIQAQPVQPVQPVQPRLPVQPHPEPEPVPLPLAPHEKAVPSTKSSPSKPSREGSSPKSRHEDDDSQNADEAERARRLHYTYPNSIFEGWVWKRSRILKVWRRRWVVLLPGQLMSFRNRKDRDPTELLPAESIYRVYSADGDVQQARCFCVVVRQRNYYMVTDDESQKRTWIQEIDKALRKKQGN